MTNVSNKLHPRQPEQRIKRLMMAVEFASRGPVSPTTLEKQNFYSFYYYLEDRALRLFIGRELSLFDRFTIKRKKAGFCFIVIKFLPLKHSIHSATNSC